MKKNIRIAICAPNQSSSSETFIANHVKELQGEIFFLYGGWLPVSFNNSSIASSLKLKVNSSYGLFSKYIKTKKTTVFSHSQYLEFFLQEYRIDVVLCEYGVTGTFVGPICKKMGIPFVVHFHGFDAYHHVTIQQYGDQYRNIVNEAVSVVAVSQDMKKQLIKLGIKEDKIHLIHYGVDINLFKTDLKKQFYPKILSVGRFVTKKAPHITLLVFSEILKEFPDTKLIMAGDAGLGNSPELLIACKQLVKALNIEQSVEFTGAVSQKEIAQLMMDASIYLQHSVISETGDSEGTPNTIIEASASGLCVIATKHGGIPDIVIDNETGYLCDELDLKSMTSLLKKALSNPNQTQAMGIAASKRVTENFNLPKQLGKLYDVMIDAQESTIKTID